MALDSRDYYSLSEFVEYMKPANLVYLEGRCGKVFWNQENVEQPPISERIKDVIQKLTQRGPSFRLIQFWAAKTRGDRRFLTTFNQPFALRWFCKRRCSYIKQCMSRDIYISGEGDEKEEGKEQLGPVGRAFINQLPESTPNMKYYSLQEFPLRDHARLANISSLTALPVFEVQDLRTCVGVLALASGCCFSLEDLDKCEQALKAVGLTFNPRRQRHFQPDPEVQEDLWEQIKQAFKVVVDTHPLALALVFIPSTSCGNDECCQTCSDLGLLQLAVCRESSYSYSIGEFITAHVAFHLQEGKGVAGKALTSRKSYFCRNICDLSIAEYPLVHYARDVGLDLSFAICLQVGQSENDHLILEFFLLPGNYSYNYTCSLLESLLTKLKQQFQSCRIVTEDVPGEEVLSKVINSIEDDEIDHLPVFENTTLPPRLRIWRYDLLSGDPLEKLDYPEAGNLTYSISEFLEYVKPAELTYWCPWPKQEQHDFVFWSQKNDESQALESLDGTSFNNCSISGRIKHVLQQLQKIKIIVRLTQFWSPERRGSRCFLTTANQPFALRSLDKTYCYYRKHCMNLNIYTFEEGDEEEKQKEQLGPVGRAFCNRQPEWSPDVISYTPKEFPQQDLALARLCGLQELVVVPVFEARGQMCVGVLEFLGHGNGLYFRCLEKPLAKALSEVGLTSNYCYARPGSKGRRSSKEIKQLFNVVAQTYPLALALAFVPFSSCGNDEYCHNSSDLGFLKLAFSEDILGYNLIRGHKDFYLQNGKGVSGKAFASQKSLFCKNICDLSITEYPFVHYARTLGLTLSFAIYLQTTKSDKDPFVLEFFLLPGNYSYNDTYLLLGSLLTTVKQHLRRFRIASEDLQEVFPQAIISSNDDEVDRLRVIQNSGHSSGLQMLQNDEEMNQVDFADQHVMLEGNATNSGKHVVNVEGDVSVTHTKKGKKPDISYDDLKQHFGEPLDEVAASLGVKLPFTSKLAELEEEVAKRFKLKVGSFSMMYQDDEDDWILITCDADLQYGMKILSSLGGTTIRMSVKLNSN